MTAPPVIPADKLAANINGRLDDMQRAEIEEIDVLADLERIRRQKRTTELSYITAGLAGSNEKARQAELDDLLRADVSYVDLISQEDFAAARLAALRVEISDHKRHLALEMELLRHARPTSD